MGEGEGQEEGGTSNIQELPATPPAPAPPLVTYVSLFMCVHIHAYILSVSFFEWGTGAGGGM